MIVRIVVFWFFYINKVLNEKRKTEIIIQVHLLFFPMRLFPNLLYHLGLMGTNKTSHLQFLPEFYPHTHTQTQQRFRIQNQKNQQ